MRVAMLHQLVQAADSVFDNHAELSQRGPVSAAHGGCVCELAFAKIHRHGELRFVVFFLRKPDVSARD